MTLETKCVYAFTENVGGTPPAYFNLTETVNGKFVLSVRCRGAEHAVPMEVPEDELTNLAGAILHHLHVKHAAAKIQAEHISYVEEQALAPTTDVSHGTEGAHT